MATRLTSLNSYRSGGTYGSGEDPPKALDNKTGTKLCNTNFSSIAPYWMVLDAGAVYYPSSYYRIYSANDVPERDPRNWLLQGSYDNVNWVTIDTVTNHGSWGSRQSMEQLGTLGKISGYVLDGEDPVENAIVTLIDSDSDTVVGTATSDYNGYYEFTDLPYQHYHAIVEYDDGEEQFNAKSLPFLRPVTQEEYGAMS